MIFVARDMTVASCHDCADIFSGKLLFLAVLSKVNVRASDSILYESHRGFCQVPNGVDHKYNRLMEYEL
jgi:hypothetical protein